MCIKDQGLSFRDIILDAVKLNLRCFVVDELQHGIGSPWITIPGLPDASRVDEPASIIELEGIDITRLDNAPIRRRVLTENRWDMCMPMDAAGSFEVVQIRVGPNDKTT